jgi:hypothetical protein
MSSDADWPWFATDFFMFSPWKFQKKGWGKFRRAAMAFVNGPSLGDDGWLSMASARAFSARS